MHSKDKTGLRIGHVTIRPPFYLSYHASLMSSQDVDYSACSTGFLAKAWLHESFRIRPYVLAGKFFYQNKNRGIYFLFQRKNIN